MQITIGKILSVVIAIGYAVIAFRHQGATGLKYSVSLLLPLACIWFPEEIGNLTSYFRSGYVNVQTPGDNNFLYRLVSSRWFTSPHLSYR
jgi:hypothetical protein